ncbi:DUF4340 domain-containing protein [Desulfobulbus sp.]|uniref:DUF4340 domain-containing protein n=1 Tax=Desulfobulbus sp. TaxID=895 RepID=UPI0027BA12CB|nr:DUF4340 domain-containing protein [Desulfobulbus sp.]
MKRWIVMCAIVALAQAGLAVWTNLARHAGETQVSKGPVLNLKAAEVNELLLEDGQGQKLALKKEADRWLLPDSGAFPADSERVQGLIDRLAGLQRGWPEATTAEASTRFKVAPDTFERKLSLRANGKDVAVVYFGISPGLRKVYLRADKDADIQAMPLTPNELELQVDNWIDAGILRLKPEQVTRVDLPNLHLERTQDGLQPADIKPDEELVKERRDALVKRLTGLSISAILGKESKPEYGLDTPVLRYTVELEGGVKIDYLVGQPPKPEKPEGQAAPEDAQPPQPADNSYVVKASNQEQLLRIDGWQIEELKNAARASLVRTKAQQPAAPQQSATPDTTTIAPLDATAEPAGPATSPEPLSTPAQQTQPVNPPVEASPSPGPAQ